MPSTLKMAIASPANAQRTTGELPVTVTKLTGGALPGTGPTVEKPTGPGKRIAVTNGFYPISHLRVEKCSSAFDTRSNLTIR